VADVVHRLPLPVERPQRAVYDAHPPRDPREPYDRRR
jgi:hypothetical protein